MSATTDTLPAAAKIPDEPQISKWLLLFYLAGDRMLSATMISQLKELTDAGFQKDATVLVYFDPNCNGRGARIFNVNHNRKQRSKAAGRPTTVIGDGNDPFVRNIGEDLVETIEQTMTASDSLAYFLKQATTKFRAENYMLFLMGHGTIVGNDAFLPDPDDNSAITVVQLGTILRTFAADVRGVEEGNEGAAPEESIKSELHLVGFHSCAMSSVELAYELQGTARYTVGTQGMAFPGSWPYRQLLKKIFNQLENTASTSEPYPNQPVREILSGIQNLSFYNGEDFWQAGYSSDLSLCSLDRTKVDRLTEPLEKLVRALTAGIKQDPGRTGIVMAHWESQSYWNESYTDLYDFCDRLQQYCAFDPKITDACNEIKDVLEDRPHRFDNLVVFSDYYGPHYQFSHGLSIYFPWTRPNARTMNAYHEYAFTKGLKTREAAWVTFLEEYFKETLRPLRDPKNGRAGSSVADNTDSSIPIDPSGPPDKSPGMAASGPPDKGPGMAASGPPDKGPGMAASGPPDKAPGMAASGPPDKAPGMAGPPDKAPATGTFGATVIKNYSDPDNVIITSRPRVPHNLRAEVSRLREDLDGERDQDEDGVKDPAR